MNTWAVSLTTEGLALAARCLLDRLETFESRQLATYGYAAVPLLSACLLLSNGTRSGVCIRAKAKDHGTTRQIEGRLDLRSPVVVIDDAISSGTSLSEAIGILEAAGAIVEGAVVLTDFSSRGGVQLLRASGYRVETVLDAWDDLDFPRRAGLPTYAELPMPRDGAPELPNDLAPVDLARRAIEVRLRTGVLAVPPMIVRTVTDSGGGLIVSVRDSATNGRLARDGFLNVTPSEGVPSQAIVAAATKAAETSRSGLGVDNLANAKVAVTFLGNMENVRPAELDAERFGLAVISRGPEVRVGIALPNLQGIGDERQQYDHARKNAKLNRYQPHEMLQFKVAKEIEPGATWPTHGTRRGGRTSPEQFRTAVPPTVPRRVRPHPGPRRLGDASAG